MLEDFGMVKCHNIIEFKNKAEIFIILSPIRRKISKNEVNS